jgi:uncharacterized protein
MGLSRTLWCCVCAASSVATASAYAQTRLADINQKTLTLLAGEPAWFPDTLSISQALTYEGEVRVMPLLGQGCIESIGDVLQLTLVDVVMLSADCVEYAERQNLVQNAPKKLTYIARVKVLPILLLTRRDIPNLTALAGRRIATGPAHSATFASGELLLGGLELPFTRVAQSGVEAIKLLESGAADAVLLQGTDALDGRLDPKRYHLLGLAAPQSLTTTFAPVLLEAASLKGLNGEQESLETVSTSLLLAAYNWPAQSAKAKKIEQFSDTYFAQQALGDGALELSATVPGWQRNDTSQRALETLSNTTPELQQGDGL